jgi:ATP-dependent protease ClpP protease subunit
VTAGLAMLDTMNYIKPDVLADLTTQAHCSYIVAACQIENAHRKE